jgi:hypothetical protein
MNTIVYRAFADEVAQIKQAQLEKDAIGASILRAASSGMKSLMGGGRAAAKVAPRTPAGGLGGAPTMMASPQAAARQAGRGAISPVAPTMMAPGAGAAGRGASYLPPYPGGAAARPGGLPAQLRPAREMTPMQALQANEAELMQRIRAKAQATKPAAPRAPAAQLPVGKQQLDIGRLSPVQQTRLRLFQEKARQAMAA